MDNYTILAVDDDPDQLNLLTHFLGDAGFRIKTACNGREGYRVARKEMPDLIISDVMMPVCDGIELCRLIRSDEELSFIPILLVSALQKDTESGVRAFELGADDYLELPYEPMRLIAKAARLIERKRMNDALRQSENRFRSLIENLTDIISILAPDGTILYESPSLENVLGYKPEELIGTNAFDLIHPEDLGRTSEYFKEAVQKPEAAQPIEYRCRHKDNSWRIMESVGKHFNDPENGLVAVINSRDITNQKKALEAKRESEEKFKAQYKGIPIPTSTWKKVGNDFILTDFNDAADEITNRRIADLLGIDASKLYRDMPEILENFHRCFDERATIKSETPYRFRTTGEQKHLDISYVFIPPDNVMVHARDITGELQAQESLRLSEERFRLAALATEDALWDWDLQTNSIWFSDTFYDLLGFSPDEVEANIDLWYKAIHPEDRERIEKHLEEVIESGEHFWMNEYRLCSTDGSFAHIFDRGYIVHNDQGKPVRMTGAAINFTERKRAEQNLRFQKLLLEAQSEASIDGILVISPSGEVISCNHRFGKMWEIPEKVLETKSDEKFLQSVIDKLVDPEEFRETVSYLYENPYLRDQTEIYLKDGRVFERYTSPMQDADDTHFGRVWFFRDITKRKQFEETLSFQVHLLNTVQQAVIATDLNGTVTFWNQFAEKLYGWTAVEALGQSVMNLTTPDIVQEQAAKIMSRLSRGQSWSDEFTVKNKDGKTFPAHITNSPVYDSEGELVGIIGISFDVSEKKEAEKAITEANKRAIREYDRLIKKLTILAQTTGSARDLTTIFRAIFEFTKSTVPCTGFFISLYDAKSQTRIPAYALTEGEEYDVSNLPPMQMSKSPHSRAISTGEVIIENDFQAVMVGQPLVNIGIDKNPSLPQSCLVTPMTMMGRIVGAVEVQSTEPAAFTLEHATVMQMAANIAANAIENVRLLEEEQLRAEQLRLSQRLESVGRMAGGIAHDFNNMLTAINGYSELTLRRLKEDDPIRRNIEEIKKAGERSADLTHQLLAFSRKQVLKPRILDLNEVISDISKMLQRLIGEDIQLNISPDTNLGLIEADPGQLSQVIMNLVVNARDAMPNGGNLFIKTENVFLDREYVYQHFTVRAGSYVMLAVTDTGVGINEDIQQYIFEPFFTTKEVGKGTGLGLATVYGIIKQSGGYIWVYSEVGKGSTFKIYLPRVDEDVQILEENEDAESIPGGTETILLVEDEEMVRNLSHQILKTCGYKVVEARNGVEALSICQKSDLKIDLLMTDVVMPQMGGRELAEKLSQICPQIRLLFTSGYTDDAIIRQGVIKTGENFIQKPFTFEALAKKVREMLDTKNGD